MPNYGKAVQDLEEKNRLLGLKKQSLAKASAQQAMKKGVVGSGQISKEAFQAGRAGKAGAASSLGKGAAVAGAAQAVGAAPSGGAVGGAISGAATGSAFGPYGAAIGAVAGGIMGAAGAAAARKAHNAAIEAKKEAALGEIEMEKGRQINKALAGMGSRIGASLNSVG